MAVERVDENRWQNQVGKKVISPGPLCRPIHEVAYVELVTHALHLIKDAAAELARGPLLGGDADGKGAHRFVVTEQHRVARRGEKRLRLIELGAGFRPQWTRPRIHAGLTKSDCN